ncbi:hypothetical protein KA078_00100 [Candidatus Woesebacteria bacterium]|nr:hypothetical protein [Candidatus Woesebacteria bacterium]
MHRLLRLIIIAVLMSVLVPVAVVRAEDASPAAEVTEAIATPIPVGVREKELLQLYQAQVEKYRETERKYKISKAAYFKLNTLQSLEELVVDARTAMELRAQVLITYLELLHEILEQTQGVELARKIDTLQNLEKQVVALREHIVKVQATTDRPGIALRADEFEPLGWRIQKVSISTQGFVVIGRLQSVYDRAQSTYGDIRTYHAEATVSALRQSERERAYTEVTAQSDQVNTQLTKVRAAFDEEVQKDIPDTRDVTNQLNSVYATTSQLLAFLKELVLKLT